MEYTTTLSSNGPEVDLNNVVALNHRRSITFINNFLMKTSNFLNNFASVSEENLFEQEVEMHKLEIAINILEAKLSSIPGLEQFTTSTTNSNFSHETKSPISSKDQTSVDQVVVESVVTKSDEALNKVKDDPRYAKYLKMYGVGVPKAAIQGKMRLEGLNPDLLDTPDEPVPDLPFKLNESNTADNSGSSSSEDYFSD